MFASAGLVFRILALFWLAPGDSPSELERNPTGWSDLLVEAGPELKGWTRVSIPVDAPLRSRSPWSLDPASGILTCQGEGVHEWLRLDRELGDFTLHVEWRFVPVSASAKKNYNSGIFVRNSADGKIWHQAQTGDKSGGYFFGVTPVSGSLKRVNLSPRLIEPRVRAAGEWNTFELTCKGTDLSLWANGGITNHWHDCQVPRGFLGLEAEGYRIEFKNVKVKPFS